MHSKWNLTVSPENPLKILALRSKSVMLIKLYSHQASALPLGRLAAMLTTMANVKIEMGPRPIPNGNAYARCE